MSQLLLVLCFIFFTVEDVTSESKSKSCGAEGVLCDVDCRIVDIEGRNQYSRYGYNSYDRYDNYTACFLTGINFNGTYNSTTMDLSGLSLALNRIKSEVFADLKMHILSLDLSGNVFCSSKFPIQQSVSYRNSYDTTSYIPIEDIVAKFPSLRTLNVSSILKTKLVNFSSNRFWKRSFFVEVTLALRFLKKT